MNSTVELIDSHCHLDFESFDQDREQVLANAAEAGITRLINPGINLEASQRALALARQCPGVYAAVGYHPYDAAEVNQQTLAILTGLAKQPEVVAIGEIGLDYHRDRSSKVDQTRAFEAQLDLAKSLNLPVIIHQRDAAQDTMSMLRQWGVGGNHPGLVLHAFSGDEVMVEEAVALGFYIGIGGPITFKNAKKLPDIVRTIPLNHLLIETDAPFLSPHPHRGKRNEPARLVLIAQELARLFGLSLDVLANQVRNNTEALFHLSTL